MEYSGERRPPYSFECSGHATPSRGLTAKFVIWERNRSLLVLLVIVTVIMLALVIVRMRE